MKFYQSMSKDKVILCINHDMIDDAICDEIISSINSNKHFGLDMKKVKTLQSCKFIKYLLENKFKLFNLNDDILCYLSLVLKDGFLKSHLNKTDFLNNKREFIRRRFIVQ